MIVIHKEKCIGCGTCLEECTLFCLKLEEGKAFFKGAKRCISCGHCMARCPKGAIEVEGCDSREILEYSPDLAVAGSEELFHLMQFRRSIRAYKKEIPDRAVIERILTGARFAGTGGNRQALRYIVIQERMQEITRNAAIILGELSKSPGFYASAYWTIYEESLKGRDVLFYDAPVLILIIGDKKKGFDVKKDGCFAAAYIQLLGETYGLGSCLNGFFGDAFNSSSELRKKLGIGEDECLSNAIGIGYPSVSYLRSAPRKPLNAVWI